MLTSKIEKSEEVIENIYPCAMESITNKGMVVLFRRPKCGTVEVSDAVHEVGYYSEGWSMECFKPFRGRIILEQD